MNNTDKIQLALAELGTIASNNTDDPRGQADKAMKYLVDVLASKPETFRGEDVNKPFSDSLILALHAKLSENSRAKQFTNEHWFVAGFTMAESAHRIAKEVE